MPRWLNIAMSVVEPKDSPLDISRETLQQIILFRKNFSKKCLVTFAEFAEVRPSLQVLLPMCDELISSPSD